MKQVADLAKRKGGLKGLEWTFVFIYIGSRKSVKVHIANLPLDEVTVLIDEDGTLYQQYDIRSFPVAIAVDHTGTVMDQSRGSLSDWLFNMLNVSPLLQRSPLLTPVGDSSSDE